MMSTLDRTTFPAASFSRGADPEGASMHCLRACLVLAAFAACAPAQAVFDIRTSAHDNTEPKFVVTSGAGSKSVSGMCVDIFRAIERVDPQLRFIGDQDLKPMIRHEAEIANGEQDVACGLIRTTERLAKFTYLEPQLMTVNYMLVVRADDDVNVERWDDVRKLGGSGIILVTGGHGPAKYLRELGGLAIDSRGASPKVNLEKLLLERGRFVFHRNPGLKGEIRRSGLKEKVRILPAVMHATKLYMAMGRHVPEEVLERVRKAIGQLEKSGALARLAARWDEE